MWQPNKTKKYKAGKYYSEKPLHKRFSRKARLLIAACEKAFKELREENPEYAHTLLLQPSELKKTQNGFTYEVLGSYDQSFRLCFEYDCKEYQPLIAHIRVPWKTPPHQWVKEGEPDDAFLQEDPEEPVFKYKVTDIASISLDMPFDMPFSKVSKKEIEVGKLIKCWFSFEQTLCALYKTRDAFHEKLARLFDTQESIRSFVLIKEETPFIAVINPYKPLMPRIDDHHILHLFPFKNADLDSEAAYTVDLLREATHKTLANAKRRFACDHFVDLDLQIVEGAPVITLVDQIPNELTGGLTGRLHLGLDFIPDVSESQTAANQHYPEVYDITPTRNTDYPDVSRPLHKSLIDRIQFQGTGSEKTKERMLRAFRDAPVSYEHLCTALFLKRDLSK